MSEVTSLTGFAFNEEYKRFASLGDKLAEINSLINWEAFRPIIGEMYNNKSEKGGRPNVDEIVMTKLLILQGWHGLSDPELERQVVDRISFRKFIGFPKTIPDYSTVWYFRENLKESGKDKEIWDELQKQLDAKGLKVKKGVIQDATFITSDPGHAKADKPRGKEAKTRRSKDGTWTKKNGKSYFGYKHHTKSDTDHGLIRGIETTTASVHDSQVDLSKKGEVAYRDKGYFGAPSKGYNATMRRGVRGHPIGIRDKLRNKRISRKRSPGERPYAVIKNVFGSGHVRVTTVKRAAVKMVFASFAFNLYQLRTLQKQGVFTSG
ncbi:MAG: IS5/IS1182 family transposase [Methanomicrobiales archaeon HGW-Methanomicrobiales-5]|nr:MAG: IS5/IS1182 family transposase [Methanomicrobiales archaeon HGW-Methanomicrobiales-5]